MINDGKILVFIEFGDNGKINPESKEAIFAARLLANQSGMAATALISGCNVQDAVNDLAKYSVDEIYFQDSPLLRNYNPEIFLHAACKACEIINPGLILMSDTLLSQDIAPRIAFRLDGTIVTDCIDIQFVDGSFLYSKQVYSGNVTAVFSSDAKTQIAIIRSRVYETAKPKETFHCRIIPLEVDKDLPESRIEIMERIMEDEKETKLSSADMIVSGGRGVGGSDGFQLLRELAMVLKGGIAASRPPCDLGWVPPKLQVGLTGEVVAPSVYFAVGISGSTQHVAGMANSKIVVAVNNDPGAGIFKIADYGVLGNYEEVLPSLISEIKTFRND